MGALFVRPGGGGSADSSELSASSSDVLVGKTAITSDSDGEPIAGTLALSGTASEWQVLTGYSFYNTNAKTRIDGKMPDNGTWNANVGRNASVTIPAGRHDGTGKVTGPSMTDVQAKTITPSETEQTAVNAGCYTLGAIKVAAIPKNHVGSGVARLAAKTYPVSTKNQTIAAGTYLEGAQTFAAVSGTATAAQVLTGYTFSSSKGVNLTGTIPIVAGKTVTPTAAAQTVVNGGSYVSGNIVVAAYVTKWG